MEVITMHTVDLLLYLRIRAEVVLAADICIQHSVSEAQVLLVGLSAKSVDRHLMYQLLRKSEVVAYFQHLCNRQV